MGKAAFGGPDPFSNSAGDLKLQNFTGTSSARFQTIPSSRFPIPESKARRPHYVVLT